MLKVGLQMLAIIVVASGLIYEVLTGAHLGYILVTLGALLFAISTKMKGGSHG